MGAELISAVLEIDHNSKPDWMAAESFIRNLPDLDVLNKFSDILDLGDEYTSEDDLSEFSKDVDSPRTAFLDALESCQSGWENGHRFMNKIRLSKTVILLAAGESWGDNVSQCDDIFLFEGCGAARVAGFH